MKIDFSIYHDTVLGFMQEEEVTSDGKIIPQVIYWVKFTEDSKQKLLNEIKKFDEEMYQEYKDGLKEFKETDDIVPLSFVLVFNDVEEVDPFFEFLISLKNVVDIVAYSFINEVSLEEESNQEDIDDDFEGTPCVFTEEKEGVCYLSVLDWDMNEIEERSGVFEKDDENIKFLRLNLF